MNLLKLSGGTQEIVVKYLMIAPTNSMLQVFPFLNGCNFYNTVFPYSCCNFFYNGSRVESVRLRYLDTVRFEALVPRLVPHTQFFRFAILWSVGLTPIK